MTGIGIETFAPRHLPGFVGLFDAASSSCFCRYWHFSGTRNEWLERTAERPEESLAEQTEAVRSGDPSARGLVAIDHRAGGGLVGWLKVSPREVVPKLTRLPVYKDLPSEPGTWTIGCLLVDPRARRRGIGRALVAFAVEQAAAWGALFLEAHPRRATSPLHDEQAWQGPERVFVDLGFTPVHDVAPYPVYRRRLSSPLT